MIYGDKCDGTLWKALLLIGLIIVFLGSNILGDVMDLVTGLVDFVRLR